MLRGARAILTALAVLAVGAQAWAEDAELAAPVAGSPAWVEGAAAIGASSVPASGGSTPAEAALVERVAALEGAYRHLATKADLAELRGELKFDMEKLRGEVVSRISGLEGRLSGLEGQLRMLVLDAGGHRGADCCGVRYLWRPPDPPTLPTRD